MKLDISIDLKNWTVQSVNNIGHILKMGNCEIIVKNFKKIQNKKNTILNLQYLYSKYNIPIFNII